VKFELTSDRTQTVDGLGVLNEGETRTFSQEDVERFLAMRGVTHLYGNLPEGITVTVEVGEEA